MKTTLKKLRQIITEEVIKEEIAPEIAAPAIAAMLQGTEAVDTSEIFGAVFDQMYGEGALEGEAERMASAEEEPPEEYPTDYQSGGAYGDRPRIGFVKENLMKIIEEELEAFLNEELDEITSRTKAIARMRGVPHMGSGPLPRPEAAPEEGLEGLSDSDFMDMEDHELVKQAHQDGIEDFITLDYEGGLVNREEIIDALIDIGNRLDENLPPREEIGALRQQIGDMSYEIERMLLALMRAGYSMEDIMKMASEIKKMDPHPADVQVSERKLSDTEYKKKKEVAAAIEKDDPGMPDSKKYAIATDVAKKSTDKKENK